jgi:hypothetical protein
MTTLRKTTVRDLIHWPRRSDVTHILQRKPGVRAPCGTEDRDWNIWDQAKSGTNRRLTVAWQALEDASPGGPAELPATETLGLGTTEPRRELERRGRDPITGSKSAKEKGL